jgi:uncharacterized protein with GYD domain
MKGGHTMATYITLIRFTQQGVAEVKDSAKNLEQAKQMFKSMGAELKAFYLTLGQYDGIAIAEAPDDETVAKLSLGVSSQGGVRGETLRAFSEEEFQKIISSLP